MEGEETQINRQKKKLDYHYFQFVGKFGVRLKKSPGERREINVGRRPLEALSPGIVCVFGGDGRGRERMTEGKEGRKNGLRGGLRREGRRATQGWIEED